MRIAPLAVLLVLAAPARALQTDVGATSAEFLRLGAGARALGMGEAYTAVADGPDAAYWNPAGLARLARPEVGYARAELPAGLHHDFLALAAPVGFLGGTLALAVTRLSQDSLALVDASNQQRGSFSPHSEVYALAYGRRLFGDEGAEATRDYFRDNWNLPSVDRPLSDDEEPWTGEAAVGASVKAIEENLGTRSASAFAGDVGAVFRPSGSPELVLAGAARHLGGKIKFISEAEPLPGELSAAAAYDARFDDWRVLPAIEADLPYAGDAYGKVGVEVSQEVARRTRAALRLGYSSRSAADLGPLSGLTAGVGLQAGPFRFDAGFEPMGVLGQSVRLGAGWRF